MKINPRERQRLVKKLKQHLSAFDFKKLFLELGWDKNPGNRSFVIGDVTFTLDGIAEKRGFQVFLCNSRPDGQPPTQDVRKKLQKLLSRQALEHLVIYVDRDRTIANFSWPRREENKPVQIINTTYYKGQTGERVVQRLVSLYIAIEEEEGLGITDVGNRAKAAFNRIDKITKSFFKQFKEQHGAFLKFIKGIDEIADREWYASLMLNRVMFSYFIQKKGFLDGDNDYLRNRLTKCRELVGKNKFHSFYRSFLLRLFHEGFGSDTHDPDLEQMIGNIPYLNGGLFEMHRLEKENSSIAISDEAFEQLFRFFDQYEWHLDTRPNAPDNEINPDILGFIFEQFINQKQMGAYYTKEDITEYITRNTVLPRLFDMAREKCKIAFEGDHAVWRLLPQDPDEFIFPAVRHGLTWDWHSQSARDTPLDLPDIIKAGLDDIPKRTAWNQRAPEEFGLPTETWRELVARRRRYDEVRAKLAKGEIRSIDDFITYNLNIRRFAQDILETTESTDLLDAFWKALTSISILDPTVGSGAFLFAALNILEPLYEAALDRMEEMLAEHERANPAKAPAGKLKGFADVLDQVDKHTNREYFILKTIILGNLYGVDIMEEAIEICKLRFFLKLASKVEPDPIAKNFGLEPLPDLDFNVRAGNTLVGYATEEQAHGAITGDITLAAEWDRIKEDAEMSAKAFRMFREQQTRHGVTAVENRQAKVDLQKKLNALRDQLDRVLATAYGINAPEKNSKTFAAWRKSHQPFHWFVEFYGILGQGGFDAVIGNPPYVRRTKIEYDLQSKPEHRFPDIYANVLLRSLVLRRRDGAGGMIVPLSVTFSRDFGTLRSELKINQSSWFSSFDNIPAAIFSGVSQRCTIWVGRATSQGSCSSWTTPLIRWRSGTRDQLTQLMKYSRLPEDSKPSHRIAKVPHNCSAMWARIFCTAQGTPVRMVTGSSYSLGFSPSARNFISCFQSPPPVVDPESGSVLSASGLGTLSLAARSDVNAVHAASCGEFMFLLWLVLGDGFHVTTANLEDLVARTRRIPANIYVLLQELGTLIHRRSLEALVFKKNAGAFVGNFNFRRHHEITRRADMLLLAGLGGTKEDALALFDYVQALLSINESAGEKAIPTSVKERFKPEPRDLKAEQRLFQEVDHVIQGILGFTQEEIDFLCINDPYITEMGGHDDD